MQVLDFFPENYKIHNQTIPRNKKINSVEA